ncbi:MAG: protease complex subunit PrcB family protein [Lachnospiraceae bacterium]|nr:protease complex subunit PrcB family protein [Lachnospiraceae bacterium]MDY4969893.1 protease complex subunit PrcB family protein [Lachnospiraceae bacterium]
MQKYTVYAAKALVLLAIVIACGFVFWACGSDSRPEKTGDVSYTVVPDDEVPEELMKLIDERKESEFRLSFSEGENLYLVVGYGRQETGGYSIQIKDLYLAGDVLYMDTELLGPLPEETADAKDSTAAPWLVVKMQQMDKTIYFE